MRCQTKQLPLASLFVNTYQLQTGGVPENLRLHYGKYLNKLFERFRVASADAYAINTRNTAKFETVLRIQGYRTFFSQYPTVRLREDLELTIGNVDAVILGCTDVRLADLLSKAKERGTDIYFYLHPLAQIPPEIASLGEHIHVSEDCYSVFEPKQPQRTPTQNHEQVVVSPDSSGQTDQNPF